MVRKGTQRLLWPYMKGEECVVPVSQSDPLFRTDFQWQTHKPNFQAKLREVVGPACGILGLSIIRTKVSGSASLGSLPRERCLA